MSMDTDMDMDVNMGWDGMRCDGTAGMEDGRHVSAGGALRCAARRSGLPQATPLGLAGLVVTVFSLTRDGMG